MRISFVKSDVAPVGHALSLLNSVLREFLLGFANRVKPSNAFSEKPTRFHEPHCSWSVSTSVFVILVCSEPILLIFSWSTLNVICPCAFAFDSFSDIVYSILFSTPLNSTREMCSELAALQCPRTQKDIAKSSGNASPS